MLWHEQLVEYHENLYMSAKPDQTYAYKPGNIFYAHDEHESMAEYHVTGNPLQISLEHNCWATNIVNFCSKQS